PFDDKAGPWTHDLTFGDLQNTQVTLGGASYFKLLLDVNERGGSKSLISLHQLQFYTSKVGSQTTSNVGSRGTLRYTLSSGDSNCRLRFFFRIGWRSVANGLASRVILRPPMFALQPEMKVFSGSANRELAQRICSYIGVPLGQATISAFPDGETYVKIEENIRGRDVFIIQPTCPPTNDHLMELLIMVDAARRASADRITAVIPFFGYARQDRKDKPRVP